MKFNSLILLLVSVFILFSCDSGIKFDNPKDQHNTDHSDSGDSIVETQDDTTDTTQENDDLDSSDSVDDSADTAQDDSDTVDDSDTETNDDADSESDADKDSSDSTGDTDSNNPDTSDSDNNNDADIDIEHTLPECSPSSGTPCKDSSSGLIWSTISPPNGIAWTDADKYYDALYYCHSYSEGGLSGWHLPTIDELKTLLIWTKANSCKVSDVCRSDSCWSCLTCGESCSENENGGCSCSMYYDGRFSKLGDNTMLWSSSTRVDNVGFTWGVDFIIGSPAYGPSNIMDNNTMYRCVKNAE